MRNTATALSLLLVGSMGLSPAKASGDLLPLMKAELQRCYDGLQHQAQPPPYFISYLAFDTQSVALTAEAGALEGEGEQHQRQVDVEVRVGDYRFDDMHGDVQGLFEFEQSPLPLDMDPLSIRSPLWASTEARYRVAAERFRRVQGAQPLVVPDEDRSADFSREPARHHVDPPAPGLADVEGWKGRLRDESTEALPWPDQTCTVGLQGESQTRSLVNTEGTEVQQGRVHWRLAITTTGQAPDGARLSRTQIWDADALDRMPSAATVRDTVQRLNRELLALRHAPRMEPYTGPAILSGRAAAVFFHEVLGHRVEGHRQKGPEEGQTSTRRMGQTILPTFLSVSDDPTRAELQGEQLNGYYQYDDEGVAAQPVHIVDHGVLRHFLMSRRPVAGFARSNGHGRKSAGRRAVGRQGNLIVTSSHVVPFAQLRRMLIDECRRQHKPYGLYFDEVAGGFTNTARGGTQAFQVTPVMVYRIFVDGRPDQLVRGIDLIGTPLMALTRIVATSDHMQVFNGYCGAESGFVPVAAAAPDVLTTAIEVQKQQQSTERPPLLPPPTP